ncbi:MAG: rane protein, partial [Rhizobacter sp.]|nr:rane protein [Rhizobacter sp.]
LVRMKRVAFGLLGLAALLYIGGTVLQARLPQWSVALGYLIAFAEAAMVGAIADWFAVVALFRHPLGLPIPHTAIIPNNKSRIGANLAGFICNNFLGTEQVLVKLQAFDPARRLAGWLAQASNAQAVGRHLVTAVRYGLGALDDDRVRGFIRRTAMSGLGRIDVSRLTGQLLDVLTSRKRHQVLLDEVLEQVGKLLDNDEVKARIAELIASEVKLLRYVGLDAIAARLATRKIIAAIARSIGEMGADEQHPLRLRFDGFMATFVERLKDDPEFREKGEAIKAELMSHPALGDYLHGLWAQLLEWLHDDLLREESTIRERIVEAALTLGDKLAADSAMQQWINAQVMSAAPALIDRYREDIRLYIVARVDEWNTTALTDELERNIGRDLQFIRINGTLVGGLAGLLIHAATRWAQGG